MRIGGLFEGYGGLTAGARSVLGGDLTWYSEIDPAASRVLAHHHPDVPNLGDITAVDWSAVEPVDVLTGGFPCQDVSAAGKRAGMAPGTRSGLWTHMAYAISQLHPPLVVVENVRGLLSAEAHCDVERCPWCLGDERDIVLRALGAVLGDLAELGYDAVWYGLRASDVGAPHPRFRVFVVAADAAGDGRHEGWTEPARIVGGSDASERGASAADTTGLGLDGERRISCETQSQGAPSDASGSSARDWGAYGPAIRRWEGIIGRRAAAPTVVGARGGRVLNPEFVEFMMGLPAGHVTGVEGLSRNDQLKILGNGVVPQQAAAAVRFLLPLLSTAERAA